MVSATAGTAAACAGAAVDSVETISVVAASAFTEAVSVFVEASASAAVSFLADALAVAAFFSNTFAFWYDSILFPAKAAVSENNVPARHSEAAWHHEAQGRTNCPALEEAA